ncbi:MAG: hypothetical protein H6825_07595 [Planctomycetes bacterium]|nr:hypothetical protein [Planctomycetota bacterium]
MRLSKWAGALAVAAIVALPLGAAIKAMSLKELMEITSDVVQARIVGKDTLTIDRPYEGAIYTQLHIQGVSLRTGEKVDEMVVFHGSHDLGEAYTISEQPELQDVRVGGEAVFFIANETEPVEHHLLHGLGNVYRIERGFGEPVVIGKGEGFAFVKNVKLVDARQQVRDAHLQIEAEKLQKQTPALK